MDLRNIILEKLCTTLTEIVIDILKCCELDQKSKELISTNIYNIQKVIEITAGPSTARKTTEETPSIPPSNQVSVRQGLRSQKRKAEEITMVQTVKDPKRAKTRKAVNSTSIITDEPDVIHQKLGEIPGFSVSSNICTEDVSCDFKAEDLENELVALDRTKSIFISGFPSVTTIKAISNHVIKKLPSANIEAMDIIKLPVKGDFASFTLKTGRNDDLFNTMISNEFWPNNTIVRRNNINKTRLFRGQRRVPN